MSAVIDATDRAHSIHNEMDMLHIAFWQRYAREWMAFWLALTDLCSLFLAGLLAVWLRMAIGWLEHPSFYWTLAPMIGVFMGAFALRGLYPAVGLSPVEELRRLVITTSAVFLLVTGYTFWARTAESYSRLVFAFAWLFSIGLVPFGRWILRILMVNIRLWGEPVAVVGYGPQGQQVVDFLRRRLRFGLLPVVILEGASTHREANPFIPKIVLSQEDLEKRPRIDGIRTAILLTSEIPVALQDAIVNRQCFGFRRLILISDLRWIGSVAVEPYDLEGFLGLEIRQNLLNPWEQRLKRLMDVVVGAVVSLFALPLLISIALLIRLDSPGDIFYGHERIGRGGHKFKVWKFRTMVQNGDQILKEYLTAHPEAEQEWRATQKLKRDPRVTRIGKLLRLTSLDELPQLLNVFKGEMSLVGPRPIVDSEVEHYRDGYQLYVRVRPGISGLWQVSGRTNVTYDYRVRFDEYYVRNWSLWLDLYILLRTFWTVVRREGAY